MFVEVHWVLKRPEASLRVPGSAVAVTSERVFVIRVREGRTEWVDVRQGFSSGEFVEVFGNLAGGDWVALRGTDELRSGTAVVAKEPPAGPRP